MGAIQLGTLHKAGKMGERVVSGIIVVRRAVALFIVNLTRIKDTGAIALAGVICFVYVISNKVVIFS